MIKTPRQSEEMQAERTRKLILLSAHRSDIIASLYIRFAEWREKGITPNYNMIKRAINKVKQ